VYRPATGDSLVRLAQVGCINFV